MERDVNLSQIPVDIGGLVEFPLGEILKPHRLGQLIETPKNFRGMSEHLLRTA